SCNAVLLSTLTTSVICCPFGPGPARTSSVAPGTTTLWPPRSTTLTCKNASPAPSASSTYAGRAPGGPKPNDEYAAPQTAQHRVWRGGSTWGSSSVTGQIEAPAYRKPAVLIPVVLFSRPAALVRPLFVQTSFVALPVEFLVVASATMRFF